MFIPSAAYRAVWRWHFYAGLLVLVPLCLLALTGGLYLFKPEIEAALYRDLAFVPAREGAVQPSAWAAAAEAGSRGRVVSLRAPGGADEAVQLTVRGAEGDQTVFVDPHDGRRLGEIEGEGVMGVVKRLHSLELFGRPFNILVEIVAGWAVILVATGVFLWWPRPRDAAVAVPRAGDVRRRPFWRDIHAVTGLYVGGVVAFLAVTGMPWSAVWGDVFLAQMRASGLGRPPPPSMEQTWRPVSEADAPDGVGWTLEGVTLEAVEPEHHGHGHEPVSPPVASEALDRVVRVATDHSMAAPYVVSLPSGEGQAFTVSRETMKAEEARTLYVEASGRVLADYGWSDFGAGAQAFEWGIAVHQGLQYGWANRILMLLGCIGVWVLAVSGAVMWWRRRPKGSLGAPLAPPGPRARTAVLGIVLPLAVLYPLTGLSLLAAIGIERAWIWIRRRGLPTRRPRAPG